MDKYTVRLTFTEPILGTTTKNPEVYEEWVWEKSRAEAAKHGVELTDEQLQQELATIPPEKIEEKGWTGFHHLEDQPILYDYLIKGFFKEACSMLRRVPKTRSSKLTAHKKIIDGLIFVSPRHIPLQLPAGEELGVLERPLRAQTAQGERVALARSDTCPAGTVIEFEISVLGSVSDELLADWMDYGSLKGLGQWRNAGYGRFEYEMTKV